MLKLELGKGHSLPCPGGSPCIFLVGPAAWVSRLTCADGRQSFLSIFFLSEHSFCVHPRTVEAAGWRRWTKPIIGSALCLHPTSAHHPTGDHSAWIYSISSQNTLSSRGQRVLRTLQLGGLKLLLTRSICGTYRAPGDQVKT